MSKDDFVKLALDFHKKEFPWERGEDCENRYMYYFLSGFLNSIPLPSEGRKNELLLLPIAEVDMSVRLYNILQRNNVKTIGDIASIPHQAFMPPHDGKKWRGASKVLYGELRLIAEAYGVTWPNP